MAIKPISHKIFIYLFTFIAIKNQNSHSFIHVVFVTLNNYIYDSNSILRRNMYLFYCITIFTLL